MSRRIKEIFAEHQLLPVVEIDTPEKGPPLARALLDGGINIVEITLRTDAALAAVEEIVANEDIMVGLGTLLEADQFRYAHQVGAKFTASPGLNVDLLNVADAEKIPYLPGVFTASEIMLARDLEYETLKYYPAFTPEGKTQYTQLAAGFSQMEFCLTGGVTEANFAEALSMKSVIAVGGTWLAPTRLIQESRWEEITQIARRCSQALVPEEPMLSGDAATG